MAAPTFSWSGRTAHLVALPSLVAWPRLCCTRAQLAPTTLQRSRNAGLLAAATTQEASCVAGQLGAEELDEEFRRMLGRLAAWKDRYYDCIVPRKVHDEADLGEWVHRVRQRGRRGQLSPAAVAALNALGFAWEVDVITAKWYHNLHAARHYKEVHGSGEVPPGLADPEGAHPDWVEASRWLQRQRELYRRQKLLLVRVRLLKELLGVKLEREYSKPRRNLHPVLREGNAQFQAEQRRRQPQRHQRQAQQEQVAAPELPQWWDSSSG